MFKRKIVTLIALLSANYVVCQISTQEAVSMSPEKGEAYYLWSNESYGAMAQGAEIVEKRTVNTKHFRNGNGTITAHVAAGDIHYFENGQWKSIFHTITATSTGFQNITNSIKTQYPATSTGSVKTTLPSGVSLVDMIGMRMYYEVNGNEQQTQQIQDKQGMVQFNELTYSNVYGSGIDLRLTQNTTQRKMDYIIQNASAVSNIPNGAQYLVFEEKVQLPNGWTAQLSNNEIVLKDVVGTIKAKYEKPIYNDTPEHHSHDEGQEIDHYHGASEIEGVYAISQNGNTLTIKTKVLLSWLTASERNFPVVIDPTFNATMPNIALWTGTLRSDGYLGALNSQYSDDVIRLGRTSGSGFPAYSGWVKFDVSGFNPSCVTVTSAVLNYRAFTNATSNTDCIVFGDLTHMANDPVAATDANRLNDIRDGDIYSPKNFKISAVGWHTAGIATNLNHVQTSLSIGWFGIGLNIYSGISGHYDCYIDVRGRSHADKPYLAITYDDTGSTAPTAVTGGGNFCWGNAINLNSTGGTNATNVSHVWYKGGCNNAFTQTWNNQPYGTSTTNVNSNNNGILNVTSTSVAPQINMFGLGSFAPATYRYMNIRYRVTSGTAGNMGVLFLNATYPSPNGACLAPVASISDNQWHIASIDLHQNPNYTTGGNITGWRYDWCSTNGVTMDLDFIQLSQYPMIDENNTTPVLEWTPAHVDYPTAGTTTYAAAKIDPCGVVTSCSSTTVTLPNRTDVLSTTTEAATCVVNANETVHFYNTSSGRYIASVSANATALGSTTATSFIDSPNPISGQPINTHACNDPGYVTAVLGRHWTINPTTNASATVRLPYYDQELTWLYPASTASSNPNDNLSSQAELGLSKYSGPNNVNNLWADNCISTGGNSGTTWQGPNGFGNVSTYIAGVPADRRFSLFNITGFSEFWLHASNPVISPLAVTLSDFSALCETEQISWTTISEVNSSHFVVERSRNGYEWEEVQTVSGTGTTNSVNVYSVNDNIIASYYRLRQVDFDGKTELFGPIFAECGSVENALTVYPNPTSGNFIVGLNATEAMGESTVFVQDLNGKIVSQRAVNVLSGTNTVHFEGEYLRKGTYIISVKEKDNKTFTPIRLIIQ